MPIEGEFSGGEMGRLRDTGRLVRSLQNSQQGGDTGHVGAGDVGEHIRGIC